MKDAQNGLVPREHRHFAAQQKAANAKTCLVGGEF